MGETALLLGYGALWAAFAAWIAFQYFVRPRPGC
jgi:hypothetical protein